MPHRQIEVLAKEKVE